MSNYSRIILPAGLKTGILRRGVALACALLCAATSAAPLVQALAETRSRDINHDGRADYWEFYDSRGRLSRILVDTNFDGRGDRDSYYRQGALVRRVDDRNFDGRPDLIEDFDPELQEHVRSVVDVDFDGIPDLVELFRGGQLVGAFGLPDGRPVPSISSLAGAVPDAGGAFVQQPGLSLRHAPASSARVIALAAVNDRRTPIARTVSPDRPRGPPPTRAS
jgi:hypothetical protein